MAREMTGMAMKVAAGGYKTHFFGKWCGHHASLVPLPQCLLSDGSNLTLSDAGTSAWQPPTIRRTDGDILQGCTTSITRMIVSRAAVESLESAAARVAC
jgi:hypothetical protein